MLNGINIFEPRRGTANRRLRTFNFRHIFELIKPIKTFKIISNQMQQRKLYGGRQKKNSMKLAVIIIINLSLQTQHIRLSSPQSTVEPAN